MSGSHVGSDRPAASIRLIAWEVTRSCMLACKHCRAAAQPTAYADELTTEECHKLLDNIASFAKPIIILTGGEPMLRADIYDIANYAHQLHLPVVMAPCGMLVDDEAVAKMIAAGIHRISISIDGATAASHDAFRGVDGAFDGAMRAIEAAKRAGLDFQINTTVTQHNLHELEALRDLAVSLGASVFNPFLLVPTGRGKDLADQEISAEQYEQALHWLAEQRGRGDIEIRVTCAPHYQRIVRQHPVAEGPKGHPAKGCMGGQGFAFISHRGKVQICGFLETECGDVREANYDFRKIWETSPVFRQMRDPNGYHGRCGYCEFRKVCGGCRARAFAFTGDYLDEEPFCLYEPKGREGKTPQGREGKAPRGGEEEARQGGEPSGGELDELDKRILSVIQTDFPVAARPFDVLAERLSVPAEQALERTARLVATGVIRRLGAVFDSRRLGYASTLVAARIPPERLAEVAEIVNRLPGVTHNYRREHAYNLWFTLTAPSAGRVDAIIAELRQQTGIADFHSLPAETVYKIRVDFQLGEASSASSPPPPPPVPSTSPPVELNESQKQLVRILQESLPVTAAPLADAAEQLKWSPEQVARQIEKWRATGVIRRFGAVVRHRRLGFGANGMAAFRVPAERIDHAGARLAEQAEISHCYRRSPLPGFNYNLYAMIHGRSAESVRRLAADIAADLHLPNYEVLFSTTEFKKASMRYFV